MTAIQFNPPQAVIKRTSLTTTQQNVIFAIALLLDSTISTSKGANDVR